jgi:hypothetical protein
MPLTASSLGFQNQAKKLHNQAQRERENTSLKKKRKEAKKKHTHTHTHASQRPHSPTSVKPEREMLSLRLQYFPKQELEPMMP